MTKKNTRKKKGKPCIVYIPLPVAVDWEGGGGGGPHVLHALPVVRPWTTRLSPRRVSIVPKGAAVLPTMTNRFFPFLPPQKVTPYIFFVFCQPQPLHTPPPPRSRLCEASSFGMAAVKLPLGAHVGVGVVCPEERTVKTPVESQGSPIDAH